jgi:hypothetical protein
MARLQFCTNASSWANLQFRVYTSTAVAWKEFSTAIKEAYIPPDTVTRLKTDCKQLEINKCKCVSTFGKYFLEDQYQLEPNVILSAKQLHDSYHVKLDSNT